MRTYSGVIYLVVRVLHHTFTKVAKQYVHTDIDGRSLKLSNLDKVIYPSLGATKAEVIKYYLDMSTYILRYVKERPITMIRFPDGVEGKSFYSKDKPDWTPTWIESMKIDHEEKVIDYIVPVDKATIVWLANLACLEIHPTQFKKSSKMKPDFFIVDLDPDEGLAFEDVKEAAWKIKEFLERYDYTPFLKTSGGKGLHVYVPIRPELPYEDVTKSVKALAKVFVREYGQKYTLQISKARRGGKILIDIYRNHLSNTCVAPYSLRGKKGGPVSLPIRWEDLKSLERSGAYDIRTAPRYIEEYGDPWHDWRVHEVSLHDHRHEEQAASLEGSRLADYVKKRDFKQTTEPPARVSKKFEDQYVVQLHDASNLHYDLRLEDEGVLMSWAIPKGLPFAKAQKRLAIRTEDHPIAYLDYEGTIPKGQYGAGEMWIAHKGQITWTKKKEGAYSFSLTNRWTTRSYHLHKTGREDQWLISCDEDYDHVQHDKGVLPMLASASKDVPRGKHISYEVKWDGIRVLIYIEDDEVKIISRSGKDITKQFPELIRPESIRVEHAVLDGEIVVLDDKGRPLFHEVISRMHRKGEASISSASKTKPVSFYAFDLLSLDGSDIMHLPLQRRRAWLKCILKSGTYFRYSDDFEDGKQLFEAIKAQGMEGIMAKDQTSRYLPGQRSDHWLKVKSRTLEVCTIIGYTEGQGDRAGLMGAMHLAIYEDDGMTYKGKVGTGFDHKKLRELTDLLKALPTTAKPMDDPIDEASRSVFVKPLLKCQIEYASLSSNGTYREPVFLKLIKEKS